MFCHLHVHSPYSFLDGASHVEKLIETASALGISSMALTDHNNMSSAVRFQKLAESAGIKPVLGCEITLENGNHLILLAKNPAGYSNLCSILTEAHLENPRNRPAASFDLISRFSDNLFAMSGCRKGEIPSLILQKRYAAAQAAAQRYITIFGKHNFFLELQGDMLPGTSLLNDRLSELARFLGIGTVAANNVHYALKEDFVLHDVFTCVRTLTRLDDLHPERPINAENYLKSETEMKEILKGYPEALRNTEAIAEACEPGLVFNQNLFPAFAPPPGETSASYLRKLTFQGAIERYGRLTGKITSRLEHELDIICRLGFEDYFLAVWDVARYAASKGIRYSGRGSAADSAVCYCLRLTNVDSISRGLLFERFMSMERAQKPDIDLDFDARFRDDIASYVYDKYGKDHVASVCTFNTYQARSAVRDFGKALGLPENEIDDLAKRLPHIPADAIRPAMRKFPELRERRLPSDRRYELLLDLCEKAAGMPRHIGTHLGGLIISRYPLSKITPLQMAAKGVVISQFDKDFIEDLGLIKLDLLSLRTLSAVEDTVISINAAFSYDDIPLDDRATYEMLNAGETVGVFQLESPAQRALQSRLGADNIEDIVASVALIRPGPIKGDMVEPFISRRNGIEEPSYIHPKLEPILSKTYGVVLFQEQVIEIATAIAGFTPGESDRLRKVMTHYRSHQEMEKIGEDFVEKAVENGTPRDVAETIFSYIVGYAGYGFCEAHAAAFADTAYKTAYLARHYPAHFYAAILSNQPMGFYSPNTICLEARRRGISILPPDINRSGDKFTVEDSGRAIRVSLAQVKQMDQKTLESIITARSSGEGSFKSLLDFCRRVPANRDVIENLILCGAFDSIHNNRRQLLWRLGELERIRSFSRTTTRVPVDMPDNACVISTNPGTGLPLWEEDKPYSSQLPDFSPIEKFLYEYSILEINVSAHFMALFRDKLDRMKIISSDELRKMKDGARAKTAGLVVRPHRPPTKSGKTVVFLTLEDEFGLIDITVFENIYQKYGDLIFTKPALIVEGKVQKRGMGTSIIAQRVKDLPLTLS